MMFEARKSAEVTILPGHHEPQNLLSRVLMVLLFDFSGSMGEHAPKLPPTFRKMVAALSKRATERLRIELACCAIDDRIMLQEFAPLPFYLEQSLEFDGGGLTALGTALLEAIECTHRRREQLADEGIYCNRVVCPVLSDGYATDREALESALPEIRRAERAREIEFVPLAPEPGCLGQLQAIFDKEPILLDEVDFDILFEAFIRSLSTYSQSMPGHEPNAVELIRHDLGYASDRAKRLSRPETLRLPYKGS